MKTLTNVKCECVNGKFTMTADVVEQAFDPRFTQRQTFLHQSPSNMKHHRHIQGSHEAIFVKHRGFGVAFLHDLFMEMALAIEPKTSYAPVNLDERMTDSLTVRIGTELTPDLQWEKSPNENGNPSATWIKIPGQTTNRLDDVERIKGFWYRLEATSEAGGMTTNAVLIK